MNCSQFQPLLADFVNGNLPSDTADSVRLHLLQPCDACLQVAEQLATVEGAWESSAESHSPAPHVKLELMARVSSTDTSGRFRLPSWAGYAAAVFIAVSVGWWSGSLVRQEPAPPALVQQDSEQAWRQRVDAARRMFDTQVRPAKQLVLQNEQGPAVSLYVDQVAQQVHILITNLPPVSQDKHLWLWLVHGNQRYQGAPIARFGPQRAALVVDFEGSLDELAEVRLTIEPNASPTFPADQSISQWQVAERPNATTE